MSDMLQEALIKWNNLLALKARQKVARGGARSEAECFIIYLLQRQRKRLSYRVFDVTPVPPFDFDVPAPLSTSSRDVRLGPRVRARDEAT